MTVGIYGLFDGDVCLYVGRSVDIKRRVSSHLRSLRRGNHPLADLQSHVDRLLAMPTVRLLIRCELYELAPNEVLMFEELEPLYYGVRPSALLDYTWTEDTTVSCASCGSDFAPNGWSAKYCCYDCYYEGRRKEYFCNECGNSYLAFAERSGGFCSFSCKSAHLEESVKVCESCYQEFSTKFPGQSRYCSREHCRDLRLAKQLKCHVCSSSFSAVSSNAKFCSSACRAQAASSFSIVCKKCLQTFESSKQWAATCNSCRYERGDLKKCELCCREFRSLYRRSCCEECRPLYNEGYRRKTCLICKEVFSSKRSGSVPCESCGDPSSRVRHCESCSKPFVGKGVKKFCEVCTAQIERKCSRCGGVYLTDHGGKRKLCDECAAMGKVQRNCPGCGAEFTGGPNAKWCVQCRRLTKAQRAKLLL